MAAIYQPDHADGCACDACMPDCDTPEIICVGLPHLSDRMNGYVRAFAQDGQVWVTVKGFGVGELSMPLSEARAFRDQLNQAIEQA